MADLQEEVKAKRLRRTAGCESPQRRRDRLGAAEDLRAPYRYGDAEDP